MFAAQFAPTQFVVIYQLRPFGPSSKQNTGCWASTLETPRPMNFLLPGRHVLHQRCRQLNADLDGVPTWRLTGRTRALNSRSCPPFPRHSLIASAATMAPEGASSNGAVSAMLTDFDVQWDSVAGMGPLANGDAVCHPGPSVSLAVQQPVYRSAGAGVGQEGKGVGICAKAALGATSKELHRHIKPSSHGDCLRELKPMLSPWILSYMSYRCQTKASSCRPHAIYVQMCCLFCLLTLANTDMPITRVGLVYDGKNRVLSGASRVFVHIGHSGWRDTADIEMTRVKPSPSTSHGGDKTGNASSSSSSSSSDELWSCSYAVPAGHLPRCGNREWECVLHTS